MTRSKPRNRAEIGRANRDKGIRAERDVGRYLRVNGWPEAERKPDSGWRTAERESPDTGDIRGTKGLVWQVKAGDRLTSVEVSRYLRDALDQAVHAGADYGLLVQRRSGKSNPGRWWTWLYAGDLYELIETALGHVATFEDRRLLMPVCLELGDLVPLLHRAGFGEAESAA